MSVIQLGDGKYGIQGRARDEGGYELAFYPLPASLPVDSDLPSTDIEGVPPDAVILFRSAQEMEVVLRIIESLRDHSRITRVTWRAVISYDPKDHML